MIKINEEIDIKFNLIPIKYKTKSLKHNSTHNFNYYINSISILPSWDLILPSICNSFTYYDTFNIGKIIFEYNCKENEENNNYNYIDVYDKNYFVTSYYDGRIIIWNTLLKKNYFISNEKSISVNKVIYNSKGDLIFLFFKWNY